MNTMFAIFFLTAIVANAQVDEYPLLEKSKLVKTISNLSMVWSLSVKIRPTGTVPAWSNIVHATIGDDMSQYGDRVPGIWFKSDSSKLHICAAVNGSKNYVYDHLSDLPMNEFTKVKVEQTLDEGQYVYRIYIAGEKVHEVFNTEPKQFTNVKLYAADPWYKPAIASIDQLIFDNPAKTVEKESIISTIAKLSKSWSLTCDIKPLGIKPGWSNVVHATTGQNIFEYGSRIPGIWFKSQTSKLHICSAVNGNKNYQYNHPTPLPMNVFTNVKIEQVLDNGNYVYNIYIDGKKVHEVVNNKPSDFNDVKLYSSDPWYSPANTMIRSLNFDNIYLFVKKENIVKTIPELSKSWSLTVDIQPLGTQSGWSNIVHATTGNDISEYGNRIPGIWFKSQTSQLHICSAVSGNKNYQYNHPTPLPMNVFTNVKIEQVLDNGNYVYQIYIDGKKVHEVVNNKPSEFKDVKLYASDPWYNAAIANIDQLKFNNQ